MGEIPAGWHPDPYGRFEYRWWDGQQWSGHVADGGAQFEDPVGMAPVAEEVVRQSRRERREAERMALENHQMPVAASWLQWPSLKPTTRERGRWQTVVGESYRQDALEAVAGGRDDDGVLVRCVTAQLLAEPTNQHDRDAIMVLVGGHHVGYIPKDETSTWHPTLEEFASLGRPVTTRAWLRGGWLDSGRGAGSIGIFLDVDMPPVACPSSFPFLPFGQTMYGGTIGVSGEEKHLDVLVPLVGEAESAKVVATLVEAEVNPDKPKVPGPAVLVYLSGEHVGALTPKMAARYLPLIRMCAAAGLPTTAMGYIERGANKLEVKLYVAPPSELDRSVMRKGNDAW